MAHPFPPNVYVGEFHGWKLFWLEVMRWGRMFCQHPPIAAYVGEPWAFDNGAFHAWRHGEPGDAGAYVERLNRAILTRPNDPPRLAVLPDKPAHPDSLAFSQNWLNESYALPLDWPWYLAVQDGMTVDGVDQFLRHGQGGTRRVRGLFLGGTDEFKATAATWSDYAHANGLRFHYARCGNVAKLRLAVEANADSVDSVGIIRNERRDNSFWRYAMEWKHPSAAFDWKRCKEMAALA